jgi:hypothetical protein
MENRNGLVVEAYVTAQHHKSEPSRGRLLELSKP